MRIPLACHVALLATLLVPTLRSAASVPPVLTRLQAAVGESRYDDAIALSDSLLGVPDGDVDEPGFRSLLLQGRLEALYRGGRAMEASTLRVADELLEVAHGLAPPDSLALVPALIQVGNLHIHRAAPAIAGKHYAHALAILERAGQNTSSDYAQALNNLGVSLKQSGRFTEAVDAYERGLALRESTFGADHPAVAASLNNLANLHSSLGDYETAIREHQRGLEIRERAFGLDNEWVAESANNLANVLAYAGDYEHALAAQEKANAIFERALGADHERTWAGRFNLGILYADMGDERRAEEIYRATLENLQGRYGPDNPELVEVLDGLGGVLARSGELDAAILLYERSLVISEAAFGDDNWAGAYTRQSLGDCMSRAGRHEDAVAAFDEAIAYWESTLGPESSELADLVHLQAEARLRAGDGQGAVRAAARAHRLLLEGVGSDHPLLAEALTTEALACASVGDRVSARRLALEAEAISRRHFRSTIRVLPESLALKFGASRSSGLAVALGLLEDAGDAEVEASFDAVVRSRALVFDEMAARGRALNLDPDLQPLAEHWRRVRERLANLTLRGPGWEEPAFYRRMLEDAQREIDHAERQLALSSESLRAERRSQEVGGSIVLSRLAAGDALVSYVRFPVQEPRSPHVESAAHYGAFVARSGEPVRWVDMGSAEAVDAKVEAWRQQLAFGEKHEPMRGMLRRSGSAHQREDDYLEAARALREAVFDPLRLPHSEIERVFVVTDGSLHLLNFVALVDEQGNYLVESDPLFLYVPAERGLVTEPLPMPSSNQGMLAIGDPDFGARVSSASTTRAGCVTLADLEFLPLHETGEEVADLERLWSGGGRVTILDGEDATESAVKRAAPGHRVLHLATHGFFLPQQCSDPLLRTSPLNRVGLALARANRSHDAGASDDGILTAAEAAGLDLTGVQWAVLSACDTGLGSVEDRGEGVFGLARSLQIAGVRSVIMSLCSVDDASAREWMHALYGARWRDGASTGEAVRIAQRTVLEARRIDGRSIHPYHWASFVSVGDWR